MRRTLLMIAAFALLLTQCRKSAVELPTAGPANENMVSMTVTVGHGGKTDINGATGAIKWSENDKLYVGDGTKYIGYLTLQSGADSPTGTFSGSVTADAGTYTFGFYYLGRKDYTSRLTGTSTLIDIPFGTQTGLIGDLSDCHIGYGTAMGKVEGTSVILASTDPVTMTSKVAIAYFDFKENGTSDYTDAIILSGTNIYNEMTVKFSGAESDMFTGKTVGGIRLTSTSSSKKYVMLVPPENVVEETLNFGGGAGGTTKFYKGIEANKFYCVGAGQPIEVPVKPFEFTVNKTSGTTVTFAPGNLYYNGASDASKMNSALPSGWNFYGHQWDCYPSGTSSVTDKMEINLFTWGYGDWSTVYNTTTYQTGSGVTMNDWGTALGLPSAGEGKKWRTLTDDEWKNLLGIGGGKSPRDKALSLRALVTLDNGVYGLVILPDGSTVTPSSVTTTALVASSGAVFLPAAGFRSGTSVSTVGTCCYYWSSTPYNSTNSCDLYCRATGQFVSDSFRSSGLAVRLVSVGL